MKDLIYSPPILSVENIVADSIEMGGEIDAKSLLNPTTEIIWPLYEALAQDILGLSKEEIQQPAFEKWCKLPHPEMHAESVACFASWITIRKLMIAAGCGDFGLRDVVLKPDKDRTIIFLSALINYGKFRKDREDGLADLQDESVQESKVRYENAIIQAKHEKESTLADQESQVPEIQRLQVENAELFEEIVALNKRQGALQMENRTLKQGLSDTMEGVSRQNYVLQQARQSNADLRGQIVESPEKLEKALEETQAMLASTIAGVEETRKSLNRWKQKLESCTKSEKKVQKLLRLAEEAQKLVSMRKAASKELKGLKAKIKVAEEEDRDCSVRLSKLTSKARQYQVLIEKEELLSLEKSKDEEMKLQDVRTQFSTFIEELRKEKALIAKNKAEIQWLIGKTADVVKDKEEAISSCREEIASIQQHVLQYYQSLIACAGPIPQLSD